MTKQLLSYTVIVTDKKGKVLKRISAPSRSYVQAWNKMICCHARYTYVSAPYEVIKDIDGNNQNAYNSSRTLKCNAAIGDINSGIRVGKGSTAVAIDNYQMESPCEEGTGTDQFQHQVMEFTTPAIVGSTCSFTLKRIMVNNSGATISGIREIGCYNWFTASMTGKKAMGFRDVLGSPFNVPDGGAITVEYTIGVTV